MSASTEHCASPARPLVVYISPSYAQWLPEMPFEIVPIYPEPGVFDLPRALAEQGITPDCIIQDELLSPRVLLRGLWQFECPKVFWSLDPHLNHYWQAPYAAQFDVTACTQKAWLAPLAQAGTGRAEWLPWCEPAGSWRSFAQRSHDMTFVGRIGDHRPLRRLFAEFLTSRFPLRLETDIPYHDVAGIYAHARLAPNESIQGEITQRLFLGAAQGCVMVEPRHDNGLELLFTPGREVSTYADALELEDVLRVHLRHPEAAEAMGRAAWKRLVREHQPQHRLQALARMALGSGGAALGGAGFALSVSGGVSGMASADMGGSGQAGDGEAFRQYGQGRGERLFLLAQARCMESGLLAAPLEPVLESLASLGDAECMTAVLRLMAHAGQREAALTLAVRLAGSGFVQDYQFAVSCAALALGQGQLELARTFLARHRAAGREGGRDGGMQLPDTPAGLYSAMGDMLLRKDVLWRPGFPFDPDRHLPAVASECLFLARAAEPENQTLSRKCESLLRQLPGTELVRLGLLSDLSLRNQTNFRLGLTLGIANLQAFRVEQGLEELLQAGDLAHSQGKALAFERLLASHDPTHRIRAALGAIIRTGSRAG